jgi:hypothetical protein
MRALTGQDIVRIWETGLELHPLDRALLILRSAFPGTSGHTLARLSVGQRDSCLLAVREQTFGSRLASLTSCPTCQERLEFMLDIAAMQVTPDISLREEVRSLTIEGGELHFRLPNSHDLAAIVSCQNVMMACRLLWQRCVLQVVQDGSVREAQAIERLPETWMAALAVAMDAADPLAEIRVDLDCPACGHCWQLLFDIVSFFWTEIAAQAKRVLREVHTLAHFYSWREADILAMSTVRRQFYLEMVT